MSIATRLSPSICARQLILLLGIFIVNFTVNATEKRTLTVGAQNINYFPHYDFNAQNDKGFAWALLQAFAHHHDYHFEYVALPIKRLKYEFHKGNLDFAFPDNPKWDSTKTIDKKYFSQSIIRAMGGTMVLPAQQGLGIQKFKILSVPLGFTPVMWHPYLDTNKVRLMPVADSEAALQAVLLGRADGADIEFHVAQQLLTNMGKAGQLVFDPSLPYDPVTFHLSTFKHPKIIAQLNQFLSQQKALTRQLLSQYQIKAPAHIIKQHQPE